MVNASPKTEFKMRTDRYWDRGQLVATVSGRGAGNMHLDLSLPDFSSPEEVCRSVELVLPREERPLKPRTAVEQGGRFLISFRSSAVAVSNRLPETAVVCWKVNGSENHMLSVNVVSNAEVTESPEDRVEPLPSRRPFAFLRQPAKVILAVFSFALLAALIVSMASHGS